MKPKCSYLIIPSHLVSVSSIKSRKRPERTAKHLFLGSIPTNLHSVSYYSLPLDLAALHRPNCRECRGTDIKNFTQVVLFPNYQQTGTADSNPCRTTPLDPGRQTYRQTDSRRRLLTANGLNRQPSPWANSNRPELTAIDVH